MSDNRRWMDMEMVDEISRIIQLRQEKFGEPLDTSIKVVLLNYGDRKRIAHCVSGDWSGPKETMAKSAKGLPLCPRCHRPCTEERKAPHLALVEGYDAFEGVLDE